MPVYRVNAKKFKAINESPADKLVTVYTLQHREAFKAALTKGYLSGNPNFCYDGMFVEQYEWMREQMSARLSGFSGDLPVWCHLGVVQPTAKLLRIKARVPKGRILFSNYDLWETVLNFFPITYSEDSPLNDLFPVGGFESIKDVPDAIKQTWLEIFNNNADTSYADPTQIQACVDRIYLSDIIDVTEKHDSSRFHVLASA